MDDDFDFHSAATPSTSGRPTRTRKSAKARDEYYDDDDFEAPSRIKLKMGGGGGDKGAAGTGTGTGPGEPNGVSWDRELDSEPEEPLSFEEHLILRVPPAMAPMMKDMVERREIPSDVWFKFKDSRRAVFHFGGKLHGAKLVDLPTLTESQKMTGTGGQSVKVADISQMLLVEDEVADETQVTRDAFNIEDFIYPHGLTPPLKHVRKRRFRKRINKRTIEIVESAVEALLEQDAKADEVKYEYIDPDAASDDEYGSPGASQRGAGDNDMDSIGAPTPARGDDDGDMEGGEDEEEEEEGSGYDSDLANEINKGLEAMNASENSDDSGSDDGGLFGSDSDDDDEEEEEEEEPEDDPVVLEQKRRIKLLAEEVVDLDKAIAGKEAELAKNTNPIFKKRFEDTIKKLTVDRDLKRNQHVTAQREMEKKMESRQEASAAPSQTPVIPDAPSASQPPAAGPASGEDAMDQSL
ncbi:transcription initiation factor TFIID subunit 6 [Pseudohyphozyma bogoriensis]|nr:transcription initiation factor TFIID subunit 6 [Pseudohyphozyma bogoriensis]